MKPLEDELRNALRRREPPPGFAHRVMARVEARASAKKEPGRPWAFWTWFGYRARLGFAAVAAALLLAVSISVWRQHRIEVERREGEAARVQVLEALRITSVKLNRVRAKVRAASEDGWHNQEPEQSRD